MLIRPVSADIRQVPKHSTLPISRTAVALLRLDRDAGDTYPQLCRYKINDLITS